MDASGSYKSIQKQIELTVTFLMDTNDYNGFLVRALSLGELFLYSD